MPPKNGDRKFSTIAPAVRRIVNNDNNSLQLQFNLIDTDPHPPGLTLATFQWGAAHDGMIVERINRFLNSSLTIFCNEHGANIVALEGILMALYAWNSAPVVGTDISRSLIVVGREFQFPIDFSADMHHVLTSNPAKFNYFASDQAILLSCCREVARELIHHHRSYHREYINSRRPSPRIYTMGNLVYSKCSVKFKEKRGLVGKLMESFTGPWKVVDKLQGSSYKLSH